MTIAERFGATIDIRRPADHVDGVFFVKRREAVDHDSFIIGVMTTIGGSDRLVFHHRVGIAVVTISFSQARRLERAPWVDVVGSVRFDPAQFAAVTGVPIGSH